MTSNLGNKHNQAGNSQALTINQMKSAIVRLYTESNRKNLSIFAELFAPDFVNYGGAGFTDLHGADKFRELYEQYLVSFPDLNFHLEDVLAEGDFVGLRATITGTHTGNFLGMVPPTGKFVTWTGTSISRFNAEGLMDARWQEIDALSLMQQFGVIPTPPGMEQKTSSLVPPYLPGAGYASPEENKTAFLRLVEEVWNQGNLAVADELFHPQATNPYSPHWPLGSQSVKDLVSMYRAAMPDYQTQITTLIADGNCVMAHFTHSGTHQNPLMGVPATGKKATWGQIFTVRFSGNQIVESWNNEDVMALMQQLGVGGEVSAAA